MAAVVNANFWGMNTISAASFFLCQRKKKGMRGSEAVDWE
jgi:hypothetical protein